MPLKTVFNITLEKEDKPVFFENDGRKQYKESD